jgi:hypothetical protein
VIETRAVPRESNSPLIPAIRREDMTVDELRAEARKDLARGTDLIWQARVRLSALLDRGERVTTAYNAAVRASEACDRALAKAPKRRGSE